MDANSDEYFVYAIVGGSNSTMFDISGNQLILRPAGQVGRGFVVNIQSTDHEGLTVVQSFTINDGLCALSFFVFLRLCGLTRLSVIPNSSGSRHRETLFFFLTPCFSLTFCMTDPSHFLDYFRQRFIHAIHTSTNGRWCLECCRLQCWS